MALAHRFSVRLGLCGGQDAVRAERHLEAAGLPTRIDEIPGGELSLETLLRGIGQDKKVSRGRLTFILTRGIGQAFIASAVDQAEVAAFLVDELS